MTTKISIDCMGSDLGSSAIVNAAVSFANREDDAELVLVGSEKEIGKELKNCNTSSHPRISVKNAFEVITMDDSIETALRHKKNSSMRVSLNMLKAEQVQACVSAGNTGALMAVSRYVLKTLRGVDRPAICTTIPNQKKIPTYMLDLGANVDCEPLHLHQFALMGSALVSAIENKSWPTIGLLNIGKEGTKGNEVSKKTAEMLWADHEKGILNFYGNVEGNDIFEGTTDIVVCDGFVGNVTLKASEGLGNLVKSILVTEFKSGILNMLGAVVAHGAVSAISSRLNPSRYNGASLLGLRGLVFKSHGSADSHGHEWAIQRAFDAARNNALSLIATTVADLIP
jgi:glycerol-3-phosphate acyltransferase PlsX